MKIYRKLVVNDRQDNLTIPDYEANNNRFEEEVLQESYIETEITFKLIQDKMQTFYHCFKKNEFIRKGDFLKLNRVDIGEYLKQLCKCELEKVNTLLNSHENYNDDSNQNKEINLSATLIIKSESRNARNSSFDDEYMWKNKYQTELQNIGKNKFYGEGFAYDFCGESEKNESSNDRNSSFDD